METQAKGVRGSSERYPPPGELGAMDSAAIRHLAFLAEVSRLLGTSLDYQVTVNESVRVLVPGFADVCSVFIEESGKRVRVAEAGLDPTAQRVIHELHDLPIPRVLDALFDDVLYEGRARLIEDYRAMVSARAMPGDPYVSVIERLGVTQAIVAPVFVRGVSTGALTLGMLGHTGRRFEGIDASFAEELAYRVGLAIDNARLYGRAEAARRVMEQRESALVEERRTFEALYRLGSALATELDEDSLVQRVSDAATQLTGASFGRFSFNVHKDPVFLRDLETGWPEPVASYLSVPVKTRAGEVLGGLCIGHPEPNRFTREHQRLVVGIAEQASIALENARLYSQLRASEANAQNASAVAREAERRKDEFLAMLGHELRNPLAPMVTALELMRMRGVTGREVQIIERQVGHLVRLVDDLLDVARVTRGKIDLRRQRIELATVVTRALELAGSLIEQRSHRLEIDVPQGLHVFGDPTRLAQVVSNLLANAAKYTDISGEIVVRGWRENADVVLSVRDNGSGIDPAALPQIFEPFVQSPQASDRAQGGIGIGLTLVRSLVQLHGGKVAASSDGAGKGSEFVVSLPVAPEVDVMASSSRNGLPAPQPTQPALRVLVVDDNADAAQMMSDALRALGHEVSTAEDGPTALRVAESTHPDVAVLDIGLPVMDGYELATLLLRLDPAPSALIAVTGYGQPEDRARGVKAGFDVHLVKPVDLSTLERTIAATQRRA